MILASRVCCPHPASGFRGGLKDITTGQPASSARGDVHEFLAVVEEGIGSVGDQRLNFLHELGVGDLPSRQELGEEVFERRVLRVDERPNAVVSFEEEPFLEPELHQVFMRRAAVCWSGATWRHGTEGPAYRGAVVGSRSGPSASGSQIHEVGPWYRPGCLLPGKWPLCRVD